MAKRRVLMLEGPNGHAFFLKETMLADGLADEVDLIGRAEALNEMLAANAYDMVVINLAEAWEQGIQLLYSLSQLFISCPIVLIISPDMAPSLPVQGRYIKLFTPLSLGGFSRGIRAVFGRLSN